MKKLVKKFGDYYLYLGKGFEYQVNNQYGSRLHWGTKQSCLDFIARRMEHGMSLKGYPNTKITVHA